ncbi:MAG: outer membrane protein [Rhodomicrobium sp.]
MIRRLVLGAVGAIALTASAQAADMYVPGPAGGYKDGPAFFSWAGWYAGVNGGYAWGGEADVSSAYPGYCTLAPCGGHSSGSTTADGGFGGGQIGYNWQRDRLVFGLEADIQGAGVDGSVTVGGPASGSTSLDWFGTVRGRLGLTVMGGTSLVYVTGGLAYGGVDDKLTVPGASKSDSQVAAGYVLGAGIEHSYSPSWSVKAEYQYFDLGSDALSLSHSGVTAEGSYDHNYQTVRVGVNYHFLPSYEPLK